MAKAKKAKELVIKEVMAGIGSLEVTSPLGVQFSVHIADSSIDFVEQGHASTLCSGANDYIYEVLTMNDEHFDDLVSTITAVRAKLQDIGISY